MRRQPYRGMLIATLLAVAPMPILVLAMTASVNPSCVEWCDLNRTLAIGAVTLIALVWVVTIVAIAWSWRRREPAVAGVVALTGGFAWLGAVVLPGLLPAQGTGSPGYLAPLVCMLVALTLALPPSWSLANLSGHPRVGAAANAVVATSAALGWFAFLVLGTTVYGSGHGAFSLALTASIGAAGVLAIAAWRNAPPGRRVGLAAIASTGGIIVGSAALAAMTGESTGVAVSAAVALLGGGWAWTGAALIAEGRDGRRSPPPAQAEQRPGPTDRTGA